MSWDVSRNYWRGNDNQAESLPNVIFVNQGDVPYSYPYVRSGLPDCFPDVQFENGADALRCNRFHNWNSGSGRDSQLLDFLSQFAGTSDFGSGFPFRSRFQNIDDNGINIRFNSGDFTIGATIGDGARGGRNWEQPSGSESFVWNRSFESWRNQRNCFGDFSENGLDRRDLPRWRDSYRHRNYYDRFANNNYYNNPNENSSIGLRLNLGAGNILSGLFNI
jgi:hypothetical protein